MIPVDENASSVPQVEVANTESWSSFGAIRYVGGTDCCSNALGGTISPEVVETKEVWMVFNH